MYLFMSKSLTYAQRSARVLERRGISAVVMRSPRELSAGGCGYCVRVHERYAGDALSVLRSAALAPVRVYRAEGEEYTEVAM